MIFEGAAAISELARRAGEKDKSSSSHWDLYHRGFRYEDGSFKGLQGFGGAIPPRTPLHALAHWLLQSPYRAYGEAFPSFPAMHELARRVAARQGRQFDLDILRQGLTVALLRDNLPQEAFAGPIAVVGDGFGTLSSILLSAFPKAQLVVVNLTKTLLVDAVYLRKACPDAEQALITAPGERPKARVLLVRADDSALLSSLPLSLACNIVSMQEMDPPVVAEYFKNLRATPSAATWFYCCNREEKRLPDGTMVRFSEYPWRAEDELIVDELCPWHQRYYRPIPPFYRPYDGPTRHRLAKLAK